MNILTLSLGSNIGNRLHYLKQAILLIQKEIGNVEKTSSIYESEPWGFSTNSTFFNIALTLKTNLSPIEALEGCLKIESILGRKRNKVEEYESRIIDIDLLFFNNEIIKTSVLTIPHPLIQERNFVLYPLNEIIPYYVHPVLQKDIAALLSESSDTNSVKKIENISL